MAIVTGSKRTRVARTAGLYGVLGLAALVLLFPFLYLVGASLKPDADVFRYPPTLLPRAQTTAEVPGAATGAAGDEDGGGNGGAPLYEVTVDGRTQRLALVGQARIGVYAPADDLDATVRVPANEATPVGGFLDPQTVVVDGEERELYEVPVEGGGTAQLVQVDELSQGRFVDPDAPDAQPVLAPVGDAEPIERLAPQPGNYAEVLELQRLDRSLTNTILVTLTVVSGTVLTSILGGYAFARIQFPGRDAMFLVYLGSIMVPFVILIVPLYQLMVAVGWVDHLAALIFPFVFNAYGTFLMRQFFVSLPRDLEEAAFVDGASRATILWRVFVPLSTPAIAALGTFMFLYAWNSFVWPFIVINAGNTEDHVLTLSLQILGGRAAESPNLIFAGVGIAVVVPVVVFVLLQRYFVENVATSGLK